MGFTTGNDLNIIQPADSAIVGAGAGDDIYVLDSGTIGANQQITISDADGVNTLRLTSGLSITSSLVTSNATQLTLSNGAQVTLLGADSFSFELGGSGLGASPVVQDFNTFALDSLGVSVPGVGEAPAVGGSVEVSEDGSTGVAGSIEIPAGSTDSIAATNDADNFTFDLAAAQATTNNTQVDITGFDTATDKFTFDLATATDATTLDQLDGVEGISVQGDPFAGSTLVNFGPDADGDIIAITIAGVIDASAVAVNLGGSTGTGGRTGNVLTESDGMAYELFGAAQYTETNSSSYDDGGTSVEYSYYDAYGNELGTSNTYTDTYHNDYEDKDITSTNTSYSTTDENGNWINLGSEWSDTNGNSGTRTTIYTIVDGNSIDLNGDFIPDFSGTQNVQEESGTMISTWNNGDGTTNTTTDTYTFYRENGTNVNGDVNGNTWDNLGATSEWSDSNGNSGTSTTIYTIVDGNSIDLNGDFIPDFSGTQNVQEESGTRISTWNNGDGTTNTTTDTYTYYRENGVDVNGDVNGNTWDNLGATSESSDSNGNSGTSTTIYTIVDGNSIDLNGDFIPDFSGTQNVSQESGISTWTYGDGTTSTSTYTYYYENGTDVNGDSDGNTWDFLGGIDIYNGETTVYDENWEIISDSFANELVMLPGTVSSEGLI